MWDTGKNLGRDCERVNCSDDRDCFFGTLNDDKNYEKRQTQISSEPIQISFYTSFVEAAWKRSEFFDQTATNFTVPGFSFVLLNSTDLFQGSFANKVRSTRGTGCCIILCTLRT